MYYFIYYFIYKLLEKRDTSAKFSAGMTVSIVIFVHLILLLQCIKSIFGVKLLPHFSDSYYFNKLGAMPFALIFIFLVVAYLNKRFSKIELIYKNKNVLTMKNGIIVFLLFLVPLLIFIGLLS